MTVFVLVPEAHTGGWVWEDVAGRLRESGAAAHPVSLTGMAGSGGPAGPGTDLETHVDDVLRVIDGIGSPDAADVVLVGHGYGIHPVVAAGRRRPPPGGCRTRGRRAPRPPRPGSRYRR